MRPTIATLALLLAATAAGAQEHPTSVRLNDPAPASQYLSVANKTGLQGTGAYTLEAWIHPTSFEDYPTIVGNDYATGYWLGLTPGGNIRFYPRGGQSITTPHTVPLNEWTHVAATYQPGSGWQIHINGSLAYAGGSITGPTTSSAGDLRIGADRTALGPAYFWRGYLDEVRIWQGEARTDAQVRETMFAGAGRPQLHSSRYASLQGWWDMQRPSTGEAWDRADGTYNGAAFVNGTSATLRSLHAPPVAVNTAVEFNGVDNYAPIPIAGGYENGVTLEAWVCPYPSTAARTIVGHDFTRSFWLGLSPTNRLRFYPRGGFGQYFEDTMTLPTDRFTHVAATYSDGLACLYVNGELRQANNTFHGPIGEHGARPWAGADSLGGVAYPFAGILDQVRVTLGVLSRTQIRKNMFLGTQGSPVNTMPDEWGVSRPSRAIELDANGGNEVFGTNARVVRSSAPMFPFGSVLAFQHPGEQVMDVVGGLGLTPPENFDTQFIYTDWYVESNVTISDLNVFVSAATEDLSVASVELRSPALTTIELLSAGEGRGRDLQTVFDDESPNTLATGNIPHLDGVRPSQSLSTFDGENARGTWRFGVRGTAAYGVALNAWGMQFNGRTADTPDATPRELRLRNAGAAIVRGQGQLAFGLGSAANLKLDLLDVQGRVVRELLHGPRGAGEVRLAWNAEGLAPGLYFARLAVDGQAPQSVRVIVAR